MRNLYRCLALALVALIAAGCCPQGSDCGTSKPNPIEVTPYPIPNPPTSLPRHTDRPIPRYTPPTGAWQ